MNHNIPAVGDRRGEAQERLHDVLQIARVERLPMPIRMRVRGAVPEPVVDDADPLWEEFRRTNSEAHWSSESVSVRHFVADFIAGRYNFRLPFQRKPQWKQPEKSEWIYALLIKGTKPDPMSISIRGSSMRGINGGNRARATVDYTLNRFPMDYVVGRNTYHYWFSEVPAEYSDGRAARFHRVLSPTLRERFYNRKLDFNTGTGLSDQEEVDWYNSMNRNQKSHTKGQLLISKLCKDVNDPFVTATLGLFPVLKTRIQAPLVPADEHAIGNRLADLFNSEPNPMDERDIREDYALAFATYTNLLANGRPYNNGFVGECDLAVVQRNSEDLLRIFDELPISEGLYGEFHSPSSSKKQFIPQIWAPSYLLGPMCWSIGKQKENAVHVWRSFLERCVPNTIASTYGDDNDDAHLDDTSVRKYETAWNEVLAQHDR